MSEGPASDIDLAECIRNGDTAAEEEFAKWFSQRVFIAILARIRDREAARDLTQEVIVAALCAVRNGQLRDPTKLAAFVHGTALNIVKNYRRAQARQPTEIPLCQQLDGASLGNHLDDFSDLDLVRRAVDHLDPADQEILQLTLAEGLKPGEIAKRLGLSSELVRKRKSRAVRKVAEGIRRLSRKVV